MLDGCFVIEWNVGMADGVLEGAVLGRPSRPGALVKKHAAAVGAKRYVQSHTLEDDANGGLRASRGATLAFDGIAEIWWESRDALTAALSRPEGQAAGDELLEDERKFIDPTRSSLFLTEEHEIFAG